jgi:hypothetical protein
MKKYIVLFLFAFVATMSACKDAPAIQLTITGIVSSNKVWRVQSVKYGDESAPIAPSQSFRLRFDGNTFSVVNPDGFVFLGLDSPVSGNWSESTVERGINFSTGLGRVWFAKETSRFLSPNALNLEYIATESGKTPTKYQFVLIPE